MIHGLQYHNQTSDDHCHKSNAEYHLELRQRFTEPTPTEGQIVGVTYRLTRCRKCWAACNENESVCLCGGQTFTYDKFVY